MNDRTRNAQEDVALLQVCTPRAETRQKLGTSTMERREALGLGAELLFSPLTTAAAVAREAWHQAGQVSLVS